MSEQEFGELHLMISNDNKNFEKIATFKVPLIKAKNMIRRLAQRAIIYGALNPN